MKRIEAYEGEEILYTDEEIENGYSSVRIKIVSRKNTEALIIFRLHRKNAEWQIYDVVIEGISLVKNYRTQFDLHDRTIRYRTHRPGRYGTEPDLKHG
jgi:phospholipid transport system substrate-binding protein